MCSVIRAENYVMEDAVRLLKIPVLKYSTDFILSLDILELLWEYHYLNEKNLQIKCIT